jgi:hypothetical protein
MPREVVGKFERMLVELLAEPNWITLENAFRRIVCYGDSGHTDLS